MSWPGIDVRPSSARSRTVYVDVCVWIALLSNEPGSVWLQNWLEDESGVLVTSRWSLVEISSALAIKVRRGELTPAQSNDLCQRFDVLAREELQLLPLAAKDYDHAAALCRDTVSGLRAGDALHLAVALRSGAQHLLTLDKVMALNAEKLGLTVLRQA
jgi:uncharacterized protein